MGIDDESEVAANLRIGSTTLGMVRLYIETDALELPLDFEPDEADEIAEELRAAAARARDAGARPAGRAVKGRSEPDQTDRPGGERERGGRPQGAPKRRRGSGSSS